MPELGQKHDCHQCGAKFYDLGRPQAICPRCGANQKDASPKAAAQEAAARKKRRDEVVKRQREETVEDFSPDAASDADTDLADDLDDEDEAPEGAEGAFGDDEEEDEDDDE